MAGIKSSSPSSLSEEELWAVVPEAFFVVFTAWTPSGVGAGTAGLLLRLTETGGDLIAWADGISVSLSDSSLLLSESSVFPGWAWVAEDPVLPGVPGWAPFLGDSLAGAEAALT